MVKKCRFDDHFIRKSFSSKYIAPLGIACFSWITKRYDGSMTMKNKDYVEPNEKMFSKRCPALIAELASVSDEMRVQVGGGEGVQRLPDDR